MPACVHFQLQACFGGDPGTLSEVFGNSKETHQKNAVTETDQYLTEGHRLELLFTMKKKRGCTDDLQERLNYFKIVIGELI